MEIIQKLTVTESAKRAKAVAFDLSCASSELRNNTLHAMADALVAHTDEITAANQRDSDDARANNVAENLIDRLLFNGPRIAGSAAGLRELSNQRDPLGEIIDGRTIPGGMYMKQVRVPLGVVGMIYEARPNVTVDAAGIGIKTGNAMLLRGGSLAKHSNEAILRVLRAAVEETGLPADALIAVDATDRASATEMMGLTGLIDVLIPRGGAGLIASVVENSKVPVIETGTGNCHIYVHEAAEIPMATNIVHNAKTQRTSVCNAAESLLVDRSIARAALEQIAPMLTQSGVLCHCDEESAAIFTELGLEWVPATEEDYATEYLALEMSIKITDSLDEAIRHINTYGTHHSDAIVTQDIEAANRFSDRVDSSTVYVNASTRFTDGAMFGLGAEIGISTQKLHARGPMGLNALTSTKFVVVGNGQVRG